MTRDTLPVSVRHLHPCISKALMSVERLSRRIGALCLEVARRDGRTAKCCSFTLSYETLSYLVAFAVASDSALPVTFPSLPVFMNLSARSGATRSGLFVFCD